MPIASIVGDAAHVLTVLNLIVFTLAVLLDHTLLDPLWKEEGFCIMNPDDRYGTSHDFCLYVGLFLAGVFKITLVLLQNEPGMQLANVMVASKINLFAGHALFHGVLAAGLRWGYQANHSVSVYIPLLLSLIYLWNEYNNPVKGFEYALFPLLVHIPLGAIGWLEGIQCSRWVIRVWGHLIYDVYIPLSMLLFYMICWVKASLTTDSNKKTKVS